MTSFVRGVRDWFVTAWEVLGAIGGDVRNHWLMASFSLVAGFGVWFAIQDVENPRVSQTVSFVRGEELVVEGRNVPKGYIFEGDTVAQVRVEARKREISDISADDFEAWVDLSKVDPERSTDVKVNVRSLRNDVEALQAEPPLLRVQLVRAETRENVEIKLNPTGSLPDGYELITNQTTIDPQYVNLTGTPAQIASVETVEIDIDLTGRRDETSTFEGDLVARTAEGNPVTVQIEPPRAKVTLKIQQTSSRRLLPVTVATSGHPAPGYQIGGISLEPSTVSVTGSKAVLDGLSGIVLDPIDVGGATTSVQATRTIRIANTFVQPTTVTVRVEIKKEECNLGQAAAPGCYTDTIVVGVNLLAVPAGLAVAPGAYNTEIHITGSLDRLQAVKPSDFVATASLANGSAGAGRYDVAVTPVDGIRIDSAEPITVTLIASP
jgi:YbbR domain-containing protein